MTFPAKRRFIASIGFSKVHECDRRTDHAEVTSVAISDPADAFSDAT